MIRFTVFDPARRVRSATWRCFGGGGDKDDVYLLVRELGWAFKFSLHESGDWRFAFTDEYVSKATETGRWRGEERLLEGWRRPDEIAPGLTLAVRVVVPHVAVDVPARDLSPKIVPVPPPGKGRAREIDILLADAGPEDVSGWARRRGMNTGPVGSFTLRGGETVWVVHYETEIPSLPDTLSATPTKIEPACDEFDDDVKLRSLLYLPRDEDGSRLVMEGPLRRKEADEG